MSANQPGWHEVLWNRLRDLRKGLKITPPSGPNDDILMLVHGTANFKLMAAAGEYLRSHRQGGTDEQMASSRARVIQLMKEQERVGHMLYEQMAPTPHYAMHVAAAAATRLQAIQLGHGDVLSLSDNWWQGHLALLSAVASPDGEPYCACMRGKGDPIWDVAASVLRLVTKRPIRLGPHARVVELSQASLTWEKQDSLAELGVLDLLNVSPTRLMFNFPLSDKLPRLAVPMTISRYSGGCITSFSGHPLNPPAGGWLEPIDWTWSKWGVPGHHERRYGRGWTSAVPSEEGLGDPLWARRT